MHKKMLAVVVADVAVEGDIQFERRTVGTSPNELRALADWLVERHCPKGNRQMRRVLNHAANAAVKANHLRDRVSATRAAPRTRPGQSVRSLTGSAA